MTTLNPIFAFGFYKDGECLKKREYRFFPLTPIYSSVVSADHEVILQLKILIISQYIKYIFLAVLLPGYIYYQLNFSQSDVRVIHFDQRLLLQNCSNMCSFLQHVPCSSGLNCSQSDLCQKMEKMKKCQQVCVNTLWQPQELTKVEIIDPEEVCFQHTK